MPTPYSRVYRSSMHKLLVLTLMSAQCFGLPGFVELLKKHHPDQKPRCATCHDLSTNPQPSNTNVAPFGHGFYQQLMKEEEKTRAEAPAFPEKILQPELIVFGDTRTNENIHASTVNQICALTPKAVIHTGDIVASGDDDSLWRRALETEKCLVKAKILYPACGNHEGNSCLNNPLRAALGNSKKFYTFELEGFTFIALDSNDPTAEQLNWLSNLPTGKNYVPFFHHPPYPTMAGHGADSYVLSKFIPQFKRLGVKLSLNGHNHGYDRALVDGITYVTSGGGGAPLYACGDTKSYTKFCLSENHFLKCSISGNQITCEAKSNAGKVFDAFSVAY